MAIAVSGVAPPRLDTAGLGRIVHSRALQAAAVMIVVGAASVGSYFSLLGWDRRTATGVNAYLSNPYPGWKVALLVGVLGVVALVVGWIGHPIVGSIAMAAGITTCWALDAALNVRGDRNWPIGMTLVAWASFGGSLVLSGVVAEIRLRIRQHAEAVREAELARERAYALAAEQARLAAQRAAQLAAEQAAAEARARAEAARLEREAAAAAQQEGSLHADRRAKVVQAFRTSAAKVRSSSTKGRAKAS